MKLSISNIGWEEIYDDEMYQIMKNMGFTGLEIAPTRIFPENPYDKINEAYEWAKGIKEKYGFCISSMQSIWFGIKENLFGTEKEREYLFEYTKKAIRFAERIGCDNLVFGCPRNRNIPDGVNEEIAISFFRELGNYATKHHTVIGMEANPPIYNTNFINDTESALKLIKNVNSEGFKLNLDIGTMIENGEDVSVLKDKELYINHVHISEPGLKSVQNRLIHRELADLLKKCDYSRYVSIEVGKQEDIRELDKMMKYVYEIFGEIA